MCDKKREVRMRSGSRWEGRQRIVAGAVATGCDVRRGCPHLSGAEGREGGRWEVGLGHTLESLAPSSQLLLLKRSRACGD